MKEVDWVLVTTLLEHTGLSGRKPGFHGSLKLRGLLNYIISVSFSTLGFTRLLASKEPPVSKLLFSSNPLFSISKGNYKVKDLKCFLSG